MVTESVTAIAVVAFVIIPLTLALANVITFNIFKGAVVSEVQSIVDAVVAQLGKAKGEILAEIERLSADVPESVDLSALTAIAQSLDNIVPDPVVEEPVAPVPG